MPLDAQWEEGLEDGLAVPNGPPAAPQAGYPGICEYALLEALPIPCNTICVYSFSREFAAFAYADANVTVALTVQYITCTRLCVTQDSRRRPRGARHGRDAYAHPGNGAES